MRRREFLAIGTAALAASLVPLGRAAWALRGEGRRRLVVIFLRGAVDGLNVVVPHGEPAYYAARPSIAVPRGSGGFIDLDGHFGLHPALAALLPLWWRRSLAFIHAAGSPDPSRSHFDAQAMMEAGTPGRPDTPGGWMNRILAALPGPRGATAALSLGPTVPRILAGPLPVANLSLGPQAGRPTLLDRPAVARAFARLYAGQDPLGRAWREGAATRRELLAALGREMRTADNGAPAAAGFPATARRLARLLAGDPGIRLVFTDLGGWDTHVAQGGAAGQLANHLQPLGDGLAALAAGLGPAWRDTVVLVISEFGRTVRENGDGGTDHGHGNVIWVLGGPIAGGKVYGDWPGLAADRLFEGRDLAVTSDFRLITAALLERHLRLADRALSRIFPQMPAGAGRFAGLVRA